MKNSHYFIVFLLLILCSIGWIYSDQFFGSSKPSIKISVSKTPLSAPFYIATKQGFFEESCVDVQIIDAIGGKQSFEQVMGGKADFGTSSDSVIVFKGLLRDDFVTFATFAQSDNDVKIVTRENAKILSSKDLLHKKIGVIKGSASDYFLSIYLAIGGLTKDDVEIFDILPDELEVALTNNSVDAIVPWEPYAYKTLQSLNGKGKVLQTKNLYTLNFNLIARKLNFDTHFDSATCVLKALDKAVNFIASHPKKAQSILIEKLATDRTFIEWLWPDYIFKLSLNHSLLLNLESQATWAIESGLVTNTEIPDFSQLVNLDVLREVNPMAVSIE